MQFLKWKFEFTGLNQILEFIRYSSTKNWKMYWSEQSLTGHRDVCKLDPPPLDIWVYNINKEINKQ